MSVPGPMPNAAPAADCLQRPLVPRSRFRQRLRRSVRLLEAAKSVQRACYTVWSRLFPV